MYKVIVCEDEVMILDNIVKKINQSELGFEVVAKAINGKQAIELIEENLPDVIVSDIKMPLMDGLELIGKVDIKYPYIKKIIISGYAEFEYAKKAMKFNTFDYLLKPVKNDELIQTLIKLKMELDNEFNELMDKAGVIKEQVTPEEAVKFTQWYIRSHFEKDINFNMIAARLNYTPGYLSKLFVNYIGETPSKYYLNLKINKAKYLLVHCKELSVRQIGEMIGYSDQSYFSRIFKKTVGKSPLEYRENTISD
ncbi:response regulator transcription factor [Cellulosilyticum sp. I15G10I2]|uniref:response regulator transcription factor n=1 Tax=Cellulosilyticum sp. I15G10I2 TaxID=1892843 RepID=UPI00085BB201|nr:response regulator [Cellulosilyticum sp. I15G10I2]